MNKLIGKVMLDQPPVGLENLLVVLYDIDPDTKPEEVISKVQASKATSISSLSGLGDRIGSILTDAEGKFSLEYEDQEFRIGNEKEERPDLLLLVFAPERPGKTLADLLMFASPEIRQNAGRTESYMIQLTEKELRQASLPIPNDGSASGDVEGEDALREFEGKLKAGKAFHERKATILREHVGSEHAAHAQRRSKTFSTKVKEELSRVPKAVRESDRFIQDGESIHDRVLSNTKIHVKTAFNDRPPNKRPTAQGYIYLTDAQVAGFADFKEGDEFVLPPKIVEQEILPVLFRGNGQEGSGNDFLMDHPAVRACMRVIRDDIECKGHDDDEEHEHPSGEGEHGEGEHGEGEQPTEGEGGTGVILGPPVPAELEAAEPSDVFNYVARQMEHVTSPEGVVNFGVETKNRPTADQVGENVTGLKLEKGPADSTAFFDFHTLHIAFEHVWKEATDAGIVAQGEALYDQVVGAGHQPTDLRGLILNSYSEARFLKHEPMQAQAGPGPEIIFEFPQAVDLWPHMNGNERQALTKLTHIMLGKYADINSSNSQWLNFITGQSTTPPFVGMGHLLERHGFEVIGTLRQKGMVLLDNVAERVDQQRQTSSDLDGYYRAEALAAELDRNLKENYSFTYFAADARERSVNFGVLLTYRQQWDPVGYQAGELITTIPLAPKEVRKFSKRTLVKKSRSQKEIEDNLRITKSDTSDTSRGESEIVNKALNKSTFAMNSSSTFEIPVSAMKIGMTVGTNITNEAQKESNQTKRDFRESVIKAAREYKNERRVEIATEFSEEREETESGEISNPNDELTVTYLFYELQRQFRVNERLHRMRPVILVAQEMPAPHEIDDDWIIRHDWILKRAILDDSFLYAFDCILTVRGDKLMMAELERSVIEQRKIVKDLRQNVRFYTDEVGRMSRLMQAAINKEAAIAEDRDIWDGIPLLGDRLDAAEGAVKGVGKLLGFGGGDDPKEAQRIRREGVKDAYERADRERRELMGRLEHELGVLNSLTKQVAEKRKDINEKEVLIVRLKNQIKDHILHYMQAIWSYEHPDQRFFRLFNTKVPQLTASAANYNIRINANAVSAAALDAVVNLDRKGSDRKKRYPIFCRPQIKVVEKTLAEVAELDNLLGFKGNYMIFPLKKSNVLTDFMMAPYVDSEFGLLDPDAPGNWSLEEFQDLYCCLKRKLGAKFSEIEPALKAFYKELLLDPLRPGELIMVPTGSLFIEALPGEHPLLEDFKALHRAVDVKKAQAEVRRLELENIRYAARIMAGERGDPDVEKRILVQGTDVISDPD